MKQFRLTQCLNGVMLNDLSMIVAKYVDIDRLVLKFIDHITAMMNDKNHWLSVDKNPNKFIELLSCFGCDICNRKLSEIDNLKAFYCSTERKFVFAFTVCEFCQNNSYHDADPNVKKPQLFKIQRCNILKFKHDAKMAEIVNAELDQKTCIQTEAQEDVGEQLEPFCEIDYTQSWHTSHDGIVCMRHFDCLANECKSELKYMNKHDMTRIDNEMPLLMFGELMFGDSISWHPEFTLLWNWHCSTTHKNLSKDNNRFDVPEQFLSSQRELDVFLKVMPWKSLASIQGIYNSPLLVKTIDVHKIDVMDWYPVSVMLVREHYEIQFEILMVNINQQSPLYLHVGRFKRSTPAGTPIWDFSLIYSKSGQLTKVTQVSTLSSMDDSISIDELY